MKINDRIHDELVKSKWTVDDRPGPIMPSLPFPLGQPPSRSFARAFPISALATHTTLLLPSAPTKTLDPPTASQPASRRRKAAQNPKPETLEIRSVGGGEASGQGGMSGGRRGAGGELAEEEVVPMEDAVKMLVEHLVKPALPRGAVFGAAQGERYMAPDKQRAVAQQVSSSRR